MGKDRIFPAYGELNAIGEPTSGKSLDPVNSSVINILKEVALGQFKTNAFENIGPLKGIVLRVEENPSIPDPSSWISIIFGAERMPVLKSLKVRIPELHAMLPEPSKYGKNAGEANKVIDMYPSFIAITEEVSNKPVAAGDIVIVDFGNRINLTQPIYLGPIFSNPHPGAVGQKNAKDVFNEKTNTSLGVAQPVGDSLFGQKDNNNQIPQPIVIPTNNDTPNTPKNIERTQENDHVSNDLLTSNVNKFEMSYENGQPRGMIELVELQPPYVSKSGIYISKEQLPHYTKMVDSAATDGVKIILNSGFRTHQEQKELYEGFQSGKSGFNTAARPGFSNHQNGIAFDIANTQGARSKVYIWLSNNAHKFGFINSGRFFKGQRESWHWSYLSISHPLVLAESKLTLNEKLSSFA